MRILFFMQRPGHVRNYESTIRLLAERGHHVHLAFSTTRPKRHEPPDLEQAEALAAAIPQITFDRAVPREPGDGWDGVASLVRLVGDFGRFLHPRFRHAPLLRRRAEKRLCRALATAPLASVSVRFVRLLGRCRGALLSKVIVGLCRGAEQAIPPSETVVDYVRTQDPSVVLVTPVVEIGSDQAEFFKAAHELRVPSAVCVASWDNLTNKGVMRVDPERVFVWNEIQRRETVEMHGIPPERVVATGAPRLDQWFDRRPSRDADEFKEHVGLHGGAPYVLYLCSSPFIAPDEVDFVTRWLRELRALSDPDLGGLGVLIRPHPQNAQQWQDVSVHEFPNVTIWPPGGAQVVDRDSKADFYDSIAHSATVVGVNTSALIEASILGKTVLTVLAPEFAGTQEGTLHYHYLRQENGGFLVEARSLEEHFDQLHEALGVEVSEIERTRRFVESFVRPHGLSVPATAVLVEGIESLSRMAVPERRKSPLARLLTPLLTGLAAVARRSAAQRPGKSRSPGLRQRAAARLARNETARRTAQRVIDALEVDAGPGTRPRARAEASDNSRTAGKRVERALALDLADRNGSIAAGPWTEDVTKEVLYWIPFLRWVAERFELDRQRLTAYSRGNVGAWYEGVAARYVDVEANQAPTVPIAPGEGTLHPSTLLGLVDGYWSGAYPVRHVLQHSRFERLAAPAHTVANDLPSSYVAIAVDFCPSFPDTGANRELLRVFATCLGGEVPLVLLGDGTTAAEQCLASPHGPRLSTVLKGLPRSNAIAAASAVAASADSVIGTLGSDWLALGTCHGVPTLGVYSDGDAVHSAQIDLLARVSRELDTTFSVVETSQLDLLRTIAEARDPFRELASRTG